MYGLISRISADSSQPSMTRGLPDISASMESASVRKLLERTFPEGGKADSQSLSGRSRDRPCAQRRSRSVFAQDQIKLGRSNSPSPTAHFAMALLRWPRKMARVIIESSSKIARRCSDFPNRCSRGKTVPMHQRRTVSNGTTCLFASVRGERLVIGCADSPRSILLRCLLLRLF